MICVFFWKSEIALESENEVGLTIQTIRDKKYHFFEKCDFLHFCEFENSMAIQSWVTGDPGIERIGLACVSYKKIRSKNIFSQYEKYLGVETHFEKW